jgi:hypothetical protein
MASSQKRDRKVSDKKSSINVYFQTVLTSESFPSIDENGIVFTTVGNGRSSKIKRNNLHGNKLLQHFRKFLPHNYLHYCGPPETRALLHMNRRDGSVQLGLNMVPRGVQPWDDKNAMLAAREFEVPEGTKVVTVWPDLFDRDILEKEEAYARSYKVNGMTKKGVLTKCVYCDSNEHIKMDGFTAHKDTMRSAADVEADRVLINSPIYACHNQQCCGGVENPDSSDYLSKQTFWIYVKEVWEAYPQSV